MKLSLLRKPSFAGATIGTLYIDGVFACHSLEDEIREVAGQDVIHWKVRGKTAIPSGSYRVTLDYSPRFGTDTPTINSVPGFTSIRMHAGNYSEDTEGCILLGMQATDVSLIGGTSRPAVNLVKQELLQALERGQGITIDISNPGAFA